MLSTWTGNLRACVGSVRLGDQRQRGTPPGTNEPKNPNVRDSPKPGNGMTLHLHRLIVGAGFAHTSEAGKRLLEQHRVAVAEEAVVLLDRESVEASLLVEADERGYEGDQRAAREVEVRDQRADVPPLVWRVDEDAGLAGLRNERLAGGLAFEDAGG